MKQVLYGALGTLIGGVVLGSLGIALVSLVALGGTLALVSMDQPPAIPSVQVASAPTKPRVRAQARGTADGQIRIQTVSPVVMHVDGERLAYNQATGSFSATLGSGEHIIQVFNGWAKEVARHTVDIHPGKRTLLKYHNRDKAFTKVSEVRFTSRPAPVVTPPPTAPVAVVAVATAPRGQVQAVATAAPPPPAPTSGVGVLGIFKGIGGESSSRRKSTSSSTRYGEIATQAPGVQTVDGYEDKVSDEVETTQKRRFRL